ncbi:hypothetical protein D9M71_733020 [compost metagenome]
MPPRYRSRSSSTGTCNAWISSPMASGSAPRLLSRNWVFWRFLSSSCSKSSSRHTCRPCSSRSVRHCCSCSSMRVSLKSMLATPLKLLLKRVMPPSLRPSMAWKASCGSFTWRSTDGLVAKHCFSSSRRATCRGVNWPSSPLVTSRSTKAVSSRRGLRTR